MINEKLADWLADNETDLLDQYMQTDKGWRDIEEFLFSKEGEKGLSALMLSFLNSSKARSKFEEWAYDLYMNRGPEPEDDER